MALTILITKKSVTRTQDKLYNITVNLSLKDGTAEVLNQDFSIIYRTGDNISLKESELKEKIQVVINNYKAEQVILNSSAFTTVVSNLQNSLIV